MRPLAVFLLLAAAGCGSGGSVGPSDAATEHKTTSDAAGDAASPCLNDLNPQCQDPVPSYKSDIAPIVQQRCSPCHFPGGIEDFMFDFTTWASIDNADINIQGQLYSCAMPPWQGIPSVGVKPAPPLSDTERKTLYNWLVCGAPDN